MIRTSRSVTRSASPWEFGLVFFQSSVSMSVVNAMLLVIPDSYSTPLLRPTPPARLNFVVQHLLVRKEALIGCFVSMSFSGSVVEVCGD